MAMKPVKRKAGSEGSRPAKKARRGGKSRRKRTMRKAKRGPTSKRKLVKFIKKVVEDRKISTYRKRYYGDFNPGIFYNAGANTAVPIGRKHLFMHAKKGTNATPFTPDGMSFCAFGGRKLMDSLSVLYGGKTAAINWDLVTNNMPNSTQAYLEYASFNLAVKNCTAHVFKIKVHEFKSKSTAHQVTPIGDINGSISSHKWISAPNRTVSAGNRELYIDNAFEVSDLKLKDWVHEGVKKYEMKPGDVIKIQKVLKDKWIDFEKMANTANDLELYGPHSTVFLVEAEIAPLLGYTANAAETTYHSYGMFNAPEATFGFEFKEVYKWAEPENVADANEGIKTALFTDTSTNSLTATTYKSFWKDRSNEYNVADVRI